MENTWVTKWIEDLDYLKETLINNHINLFAYTKEEDFLEKIEELKKIINDLEYEDMKVEISRIVASLKDAHTSLTFTGKRFIPLKFYYFQDGVYIINTTKEYENLILKKVDKIQDTTIDKVLLELKEIISHENEQFFKSQSMKYLQIAEALYGLLIIDNMEEVNITVEGKSYNINTVKLEELSYTNETMPLYAKRQNENLWFTILKADEIYIKYNFCREIGEVKISEKIEAVKNTIKDNNIKKATIDLRNNLGGDSRLLEPLIEYLRNHKEINTKDNLKVIIGRDTFSSALLNAYEFKNTTNAKLIGEGTGGKPNCYGEVLRFSLPNSKLILSYSTRFYRLIEDDNIDSLYPDEISYEKIEDYKNA